MLWSWVTITRLRARHRLQADEDPVENERLPGHGAGFLFAEKRVAAVKEAVDHHPGAEFVIFDASGAFPLQ